MIKQNRHLLLMGVLSLFALSSSAFASQNSPNLASCKPLIAAAKSGTRLPADFFRAYGDKIQSCLSACDTLYPNNLQAISTCRSSLASLNFTSNYQNALANQKSNQDNDAQYQQQASTQSNYSSANNAAASVAPVANHTRSVNQAMPTTTQKPQSQFEEQQSHDDQFNQQPQKTQHKTPSKAEIRWF